jgi:hypothetical protein
MSLVQPIARRSQASSRRPNPCSPRPPFGRPSSASSLAALLATALVGLDISAAEGLHRALDELGPIDPATLLGFTS